MPKKASPPAIGVSKTVDWKALKTSRGPATRVPALVRALIGGKTANDRYQAHFTLSEGLRGDGVVSTSAAPMVPLLCEVLASKKEDAHRAAWLVGEALTAGHERVFADAGASVSGDVAAVRAAVIAAKNVLLAAVADPDPRVRSGTAFALAWAPDLASESRPALRKQISVETSDSALVSQLLAIALLARAQGEDAMADDRAAVAEIVARAPPPPAHGAAALALVLLDSKFEATAEARGIVALLQSVYDREGIPWCQGQWNEIVFSVGARTRTQDEMAVRVAASLDPETPAQSWLVPTRALLALAGFTRRWEKFDVALAEDLSDAQRAVATSLARRDGLQEVLWGVPRSARDRRRWLGLTPPGPLEKRISFELDGTRHEWPIWKVWRTLYEKRVSQEDLPAPISERLDPDETFEALLEVDIGGYSIRALAGGGPIPQELKQRLAESAGPKAAQWARGYVDEILALINVQSAPELGGELGFKSSMACFTAITNNGGTIESRWNRFVPVHPPETARRILEKMPAAQREEAIWLKVSQAQAAAPGGDALVKAILPLLDLVPSKRIAEGLVARIRSAKPADGEQSLARLRELAAKEPGIAQALTSG